MEIIIIIGLILVNGIFAMSEMATVSVRRARLQSMIEQGDAQAKSLQKLIDEPNRFLSTVQIGITLIGILAGAFGGSTVATDLATWISTNFPATAASANAIAVAIVVGLTTYLSLIVGELVPKRIALQNPERIGKIMARPMQLLSILATPLVWFLSISTNVSLWLLGIDDDEDENVNETEILSLIRHGRNLGVFAKTEEDMVEGVLQLDTRRIASISTPRTDLIFMDIHEGHESIIDKIQTHNFSVYPVVEESIENVLGFVRAKDLLSQVLQGQKINLQNILIEPVFIPETAPALAVLDQMKTQKIQTAFIIGEHGGIEGMIRLQDIVSEIIGDFDEGADNPTDPDAIEREDGSWLINGQISLDDLQEIFPEFESPSDESRAYTTLGGFIMARLGKIPTVSDHFIWQTFRFEVVDMDDNRIDKVLIQREEPVSDPTEEEDNAS